LELLLSGQCLSVLKLDSVKPLNGESRILNFDNYQALNYKKWTDESGVNASGITLIHGGTVE
jgi:hypothetical protein